MTAVAKFKAVFNFVSTQGGAESIYAKTPPSIKSSNFYSSFLYSDKSRIFWISASISLLDSLTS